ncbi:MAG: tRNA (adenosine(37)-N6)-threonylcarbamoyltransferase complex dimerization subunit type 1 TsaB [Treponema sp.]|jgi:tRNA threonylcarbamoyladenosine biosynthesis protein TsaB|nr:tRNA (adenosine(37)-N6)-threonylcarbamoyltransferase complex dimerization subunit type 1 TsaB [Treponema sp.]
MMNLLAIDTATERLSVAVSCTGNHTWVFEADAGLRHSELVMDSIDMLLKKAALKPEDLSGVVCMGGPGSFTGLRIGFSLAKGLALSLNIPFAAIPTLDCLSWPFSAWPGIVIPALDAKKEAFFCALYRSGKRLCPDMDAGSAEIARVIADTHEAEHILLTGPGASMLHEQLNANAAASSLTESSMKLDITAGKLRWGNAETLLAIAQETRIIAHGDAGYSGGPEYGRGAIS